MTEAKNRLKEPKVALVTGAGGIIGSAICRLLKERGWAIAATDNEEVGVDHLKRFLADHDGGENAICRHSTPPNDASKIMIIN